MIQIQSENEQMVGLRAQNLGEEWIRAIMEGAPDRIQAFCDPQVVSVILTPKRHITLENAPALAAKYHDWFGTCTDFQLVASRVGWVGERLGIFYSFLLQDEGEWQRIEQQVYCTLRDGRVVKMHLLCSGFELVGVSGQAESPDASLSSDQDPVPDELLEFGSESPETASTCALLTPMIRAKLGEMRSGQVLEVRVNDPSARDDVESWSRLSGNPLLRVIEEGQGLRFFVQKK